jgi:hypothetical protein
MRIIQVRRGAGQSEDTLESFSVEVMPWSEENRDDASALRRREAIEIYQALTRSCGIVTLRELSHLLISMPHPDRMPTE